MGQCQLRKKVTLVEGKSTVKIRSQVNVTPSTHIVDQGRTLLEKIKIAKNKIEYDTHQASIMQKVDNTIAEGKPFTDKYFKPDLNSLYLSKEVPHYCQNLTWKRASSIYKDGYFLYDSQIQPNDIKQGLLGSCYFLSALASIAEDPTQIEALFYNKEINAAGIYLVFFYINGYKQGVIVDDYFPVKQDGTLAFSGSKKPEIWVSLMEKAWAKLQGCYERADGGYASDAATHLTGCPSYQLEHRDTSSEELWERIWSSIQCKFKMISQSEGEGENKGESGIIEGHAYSLLQVCDFQHLGKRVRLVQLRNPWGNYEWNGEWSDNSAAWTPELDARYNHVNEDDGTFFIPFEHFLDLFQVTHFCASGQADRMEVHEVFVDYNIKTHPQVFIRFTVQEAFTLSDDLFVGVNANQQGERLQRRHLSGKQQFCSAIMNFMLFDPNGQFMQGSLTTSLNGSLLLSGKDLHFAKGDYLLVFDAMFSRQGYQQSFHKRIQCSFWFPKGKSAKYEKIDFQVGMALFMKGMNKMADQSQVDKVSYLEDGDLQDLAFYKLSLGMEESTKCLYTFFRTELDQAAPINLKQSIITDNSGIQCFHLDHNGAVVITEGRSKIDCDLKPGETHLIIGRRFKDSGVCECSFTVHER